VGSVETDVVLYRTEGPVAILTLNRPERLNAWTTPLEQRYLDLLAGAASDQNVRAVVITGAGRGYCAGADMSELRDLGTAGTRPLDELQGLPVRRTYEYPKPLIAAINGSCAGLGLAQALACDLRFAAAGVKLTTSYARRGLVAEDGTSWLLPRLIGPSHALDLLLSARVVLAEEALALGLVDRVSPAEDLLPQALSYATDLAVNSSPRSMAMIKKQVRRHLNTDLETAIGESARLVRASLASEDFREGVASFTQRRAPRFPPLVWPGDEEGNT
jgi:enoyl-CoA hydratase/carnithine racemase